MQELSVLPSPLRVAISVSEESTLPIRMGAAVVRGGSILRASCNRRGRGTPGTWTRHAEFRATMNVDSRGATVYIGRRGRNNHIAQARPCKACESHLRELGVRKVVYTIPSEPWFIEERF